MEDEINIAFGTSQLYAPHVGCVIASVVRRARGAKLRFLILHEGIGDEFKTRMQSIAPQARFEWILIGDDDVPAYTDTLHFSRPILFRLALEKRAPADCRRVLYLDADMIVLGDVRQLWATDLAGSPMGAVIEAEGHQGPFAERHGLHLSKAGYFNSGVLLIDLDKVRAEKLFTAAMDFLRRQEKAPLYADQDALNFVMWDRWRPLPPSWNALASMVLPGTARTMPEALRYDTRLPHVVHFSGSHKPWAKGEYHPWSWLYWDNLARTPFVEDVVKEWGVGPLERFRLWLRWLRRKPRGAGAELGA